MTTAHGPGAPRVWESPQAGSLTRGEQVKLCARAGISGLAVLSSWVLVMPNVRHRPIRVAPPAVPAFTSGFAAQVDAEPHKQQPSALDHARPSDAYADAFSTELAVNVDREILWAACMLHDLGLDRRQSTVCFPAWGARRAHEIALAAQVSTGRAELPADTSFHHATPGVRQDRYPLAQLVAAGALADLVALRMEQLEPGDVRDLQRTFPRGIVSQDIAGLWTVMARRSPMGRAAVSRRAGFTHGIRIGDHMVERRTHE